jgi:hypothetical protein
MTQFQIKLTAALSHLYPDGFNGFNLEHDIPPVSFEAYTAALLPEEVALSMDEINAAAAAWDAAAPARAREDLFLTIPQFRKMLRVNEVQFNGETRTLKSAVEAVIAGLTDAGQKADFLDWYNSPPVQIKRTADRFEQVRVALGITPEEADTMVSTAMEYA